MSGMSFIVATISVTYLPLIRVNCNKQPIPVIETLLQETSIATYLMGHSKSEYFE